MQSIVIVYFQGGKPMSAYFIANIRITDEELMKQYGVEIGDMVSRWGGEYLAIDNAPTVLEGKWEYSRLVLLRFPDETTLKKWYNSTEYKDVLQMRLDAAECDTIMIRGNQT